MEMHTIVLSQEIRQIRMVEQYIGVLHITLHLLKTMQIIMVEQYIVMMQMVAYLSIILQVKVEQYTMEMHTIVNSLETKLKGVEQLGVPMK